MAVRSMFLFRLHRKHQNNQEKEPKIIHRKVPTMCLPLKSVANLFHIAVLSAVILFSASCRHESPLLQEQITRLPGKDRSLSSFVVDYDPASASLVFSSRNWTQFEEKVHRVDKGVASRGTYGSPCYDFWMEYSLWNGEPRRYLMVLAIPPLTVYPIIDTVFLAGCMVCDGVIFPFTWIKLQHHTDPIVLTDSGARSGDSEIVSDFKMDQDLSFREVVENRTENKMVSSPIDLNDSGTHKTFYTDSRGRIKVARMIPWLFPIRNISFSPAATNHVGKTVQFSTYRFLTPEQQKLWNEVKRKDSPSKKKMEAWEKLRPCCNPEYFKRVKTNLEEGFIF